MSYLHTKIQMLSPSDLLVISVELTAKENVYAATMSFSILQKSFIFFNHPLPCII
jgi:hypothetical protein